MRLDGLRYRNFRCFEDRTFEFAPRFNLLVGDNGTGKTSVLQGASLALGTLFLGFPEPAEPSPLGIDVARHRVFLNNGKPNLEPQYPIRLDATGELNGVRIAWERAFERRGGRTTRRYSGGLKSGAEALAEKVKSDLPAILPLLGYYGTGRIWKPRKPAVTKPGTPGSRFLGYLNCLDPAADEKRFSEWFQTRELVSLQKRQPLSDLEAVRDAIRACIGSVHEIYWDFEADQLAIRGDGNIVWFRQLSDGYRNMLAMVADIAERCVTLNPQLGGAAVTHTPGVVLIDEIDLHLHPKWQRHVVEDLLRAFPEIQFIATTHSPFIIQSLQPMPGIKLINLDDPAANEFAGMSVEDIAEEVQGVDTPSRSQRYLDMMAAAERYYGKLQEGRTAAGAELERLKRELDALMVPFGDDPAYQAFLKLQRAASGIDGGNGHASH